MVDPSHVPIAAACLDIYEAAIVLWDNNSLASLAVRCVMDWINVAIFINFALLAVATAVFAHMAFQ